MTTIYDDLHDGEFSEIVLPSGRAAGKSAPYRALLHRAAEMLRKHEWRDVFIDNGGYGDHWELQCPSCHAAQKDGHADDCALAALIRELESRLAL